MINYEEILEPFKEPIRTKKNVYYREKRKQIKDRDRQKSLKKKRRKTNVYTIVK